MDPLFATIGSARQEHMISQPLQQFVDSLKKRPSKEDWSDYEGPRFSTNKITISVGSFYERLRYAVDYQEEHMLRRAAIERIVRRLLMFTTTNEVGRAVLDELVRASYIDNGTIPEALAGDIEDIIHKYQRLESLVGKEGEIVWGYAAIEIEQLLFPSDIGERTFTAMVQSVVQYFKPKEQNLISEADFKLFVYIACRRVFLKESHASLSYALFKTMVPEWRDKIAQDNATIEEVASRFQHVQSEIQKLMDDQVQWRIASRLHNESIYFAILSEIARRSGANTESVIGDDERLDEMVEGILNRTYEVHQTKVSQSGTRAISYILITKVVIGLAIELPYELLVLGEINFFALGINIIFFPVLMLAMVKTVRYPEGDNTDDVIDGLLDFIEGKYDSVQYVPIRGKSAFQQFGNFIFRLVFFTLSFGIILTVLRYLHFNPASIFLFLFFLSIVTFMGIRIRIKAHEWTMEAEDESFGGLMWFLFAMPVVSSGRWLSEKLSSVNIFVFFLDFILETPFKLILGSFDSFISYVKETRREGLK